MEQLIKVARDSDWRSLHAIRREVLFDTGVFPFVYDENHPDDRAVGNTPYVFLSEGCPIGVARLDQRGRHGIVRLVGIRSAFQGRGHGRTMARLIDSEAAAMGLAELRVNAFVDAIGFYEKTGWRHAIWDEEERLSLNGRGVQMTKRVVLR